MMFVPISKTNYKHTSLGNEEQALNALSHLDSWTHKYQLMNKWMAGLENNCMDEEKKSPIF